MSRRGYYLLSITPEQGKHLLAPRDAEEELYCRLYYNYRMIVSYELLYYISDLEYRSTPLCQPEIFIELR
jgi:hypothetical protein